MENEFGLWLQQEREQRSLTQAELGKRSGVNRAVINKIENGFSRPTPETLNSIARGLQISPITIFRKAGILPPEPEYVPLLDEWNDIFYDLTEEDRFEILEIAKMKANRRKNPEKPSQRSSSRSKRPARSALNNS
jgi:transcriptional regulator with XRE-family HTH domain